jgi:hypothetical protein
MSSEKKAKLLEETGDINNSARRTVNLGEQSHSPSVILDEEKQNTSNLYGFP